MYAFFVWLPLLRMISSVLTQVDTNGKILQFLRLNRISHMHNSYHTSYFSCLHIFNNSEINTGVQMSLETLILLPLDTFREITCRIISLFMFGGTSTLFFTTIPIYIPSHSAQGFHSPHTPTNTYYILPLREQPS